MKRIDIKPQENANEYEELEKDGAKIILALQDSAIWLGKGLEQGIHKGCVNPKHLERTLMLVNSILDEYN